MADEEPKPQKEPKPKSVLQVNPRVAQLYHLVGQIITLEKAGKSKGLMIDGDLEVVYSPELKGKIKTRIGEKLAVAAGLIQELQNDGETVD